MSFTENATYVEMALQRVVADRERRAQLEFDL